MRFEKWQALANDYVIVEASELDGGEPSAGARARAVRPPHRDRRRRRARPRAARRAGLRRAAADLQPRRLGGRAERQRRAPGDPLPAPRRLDRRAASSRSRPRRARSARRSSPTPPAAWTWGARRCATPARPTASTSSTWSSATRRRRSTSPTAATLEALDLAAIGPPIETDPQFPQRTNVSWFTALDDATIRARIFERGVGETASSGTGACGAAIAHVLRGGDSPVTVQARRRRARGRGGGGPPRRPDRLGGAGLRGEIDAACVLGCGGEQHHRGRVSWLAAGANMRSARIQVIRQSRIARARRTLPR